DSLDHEADHHPISLPHHPGERDNPVHHHAVVGVVKPLLADLCTDLPHVNADVLAGLLPPIVINVESCVHRWPAQFGRSRNGSRHRCSSSLGHIKAETGTHASTSAPGPASRQ